MPLNWQLNKERIQHLVTLNHVLTVVLGNEGSGKTSFMKQLAVHMSPFFPVVTYDAQSPSDISTLLQKMSQQFHLASEKIHSIKDLILQLNERKQSVFLIIDDAHWLPEPFIREILIMMQTQKDMYVHVCLIADYSIVATMNHFELMFPELTQSLELGGLSLDELIVYVKNRYVHDTTLEGLPPEAWKKFYTLTDGSIERIHQIYASWQKEATQLPLAKSKKGLLTRGMIAGVTLVAAIFFINLGYKSFNQIDFKATSTTMSVEKPEILTSQLVDVPSLQHSELPPVDVAVFEKSLDSQLISMDASGVRQPMETGMLNTSVNSEGVDDSSDDDSNEMMEEPKPVMDKVIVIPNVSAAHKEVIPTIQPEIPQVVAKKDTKPVLPKIENTQNGRYTIQLSSGSELKDLRKIQLALDGSLKTTIYQMNRNGKQWYLLTLGQYVNRDTAQKTISKVHGVKGQKPWVRSVAGLTKIG